MSSSRKIFLVLFGSFSMTQIQVIGSIGITELFCDLLAPFLLMKNAKELHKDGFLPVIALSVCAIVGCCLSSWYNQTEFRFFMRGFAVTYSLFSMPICFHALLRKNLGGMRWLLLGFCISMIINIFIFRQAVEVAMLSGGVEDSYTTELIMKGPLFWLSHLGGIIELPVSGWYLATPTPYSIIAVLAMPVFTFFTSESGRSAVSCAIVSLAIVVVGGKKIRRMQIISRHIWLTIVALLGLVIILKTTYKAIAENAFLGEKATRKYERQVKGGTGILGMLVGGRAETFAGLFACFDNPIWGFGPWSKDENGYMGAFIEKYGDADDYERYMKDRASALKYGYIPAMPCHSHIVGFWVRNGILGLPFWLYIGYCMLRHLRKNMSAVPHWYGYFALTIPINMWHLFFSPYGFRVGDTLFITCLLLANAVRLGKRSLPIEMIREVRQKCLDT